MLLGGKGGEGLAGKVEGGAGEVVGDVGGVCARELALAEVERKCPADVGVLGAAVEGDETELAGGEPREVVQRKCELAEVERGGRGARGGARHGAGGSAVGTTERDEIVKFALRSGVVSDVCMNAQPYVHVTVAPLTASLTARPTPHPDDLELQPLHRTRRRPLTASRRPAPPLSDSRQCTMKFSHSLVFNSVPEWTSNYLK